MGKLSECQSFASGGRMFRYIGGFIFIAILMAMIKGFVGFSKREDSRMERVAQNAELSKAETVALKVCTADLVGKVFDVKLPAGKVIKTGISRDVCPCHARAMARIFRDNRYSSHGPILENVAGAARIPKINPADLRKPSTPTREIMEDVSDSLMDCTLKMRTERINAAVSKKIRDQEGYDD
jgi:hypothetical protein